LACSRVTSKNKKSGDIYALAGKKEKYERRKISFLMAQARVIIYNVYTNVNKHDQ
jgi:hypothetical protein